MGHLPQDFLIKQGIRGAECFSKVGRVRMDILYLHFNREAIKCNPLSITVLIDVTFVSYPHFMRLSL